MPDAADAAAARVGGRAPDVTLPDTHGTPVRLADLTAVLVVFVPFAFTAVCGGELRALRDARGEFDGVGVRVVAISCDPPPTLRAWSEQERFGFDLLSDFWPHGAAARAFGVFDDGAGFAQRGSFLLDAAGIVRWTVLSPPGQARSLDAYRAALAAL